MENISNGKETSLINGNMNISNGNISNLSLRQKPSKIDPNPDPNPPTQLTLSSNLNTPCAPILDTPFSLRLTPDSQTTPGTTRKTRGIY